MSLNLADLPLDLPPDLSSLVLTSSGQNEFKFGRSTPRSGRSTPSTSSQDELFGRSIPPGTDI